MNNLREEIEKIINDHCAHPYVKCPIWRLDKGKSVAGLLTDYFLKTAPEMVCLDKDVMRDTVVKWACELPLCQAEPIARGFNSLAHALSQAKGVIRRPK